MNKYNPGPKILDVGSGLGGPCRVLEAEFGAECIGVEYL
jgi:cyclopropane fatty-acyl-phospholipid synthase-like methyltransferase